MFSALHRSWYGLKNSQNKNLIQTRITWNHLELRDQTIESLCKFQLPEAGKVFSKWQAYMQ